MWVYDIDIKRSIDMGETIFSLFLGISNSRVTSIMKLKPHAEKNSTHVEASCTAVAFKDHHLTRQLGNPSLVTLASLSAPKVKRHCRRGMRRSRHRKTAAKKAGLQVINQHKYKGAFSSPFSLGVQSSIHKSSKDFIVLFYFIE